MEGRARYLWAWALALVPTLVLVWRFDHLCDDAYISFRYSKHFAEGLGLRYNLGVEPPVEGYSNLLWVLWLSIPERLGHDVTVWARWSSVVAGALLLLLVTRFVERRLELSFGATLATALFLGTLPAYAVWSTSGLAMLPAALLLFGVFERLLGDPEQPHPWQAALLAALAVLLRVDGLAFVGLVLLVSGGTWLWERRPGLFRAVLIVGATCALVTAVQLLWRHANYGEWVPNTAKTKGGFTWFRFGRGLDYLASYAFSLPALCGVLLLGPLVAKSRDRLLALACAALVAANLAYAAYVGGDHMAMWRLFVPTLSFLAVLFAFVAQRLSSSPAKLGAWTAAVVGLSLLPSFDVQLTPKSWREARHFRLGYEYKTEYQHWEMVATDIRKLAQLGRELAYVVEPGESLVYGAIGAVGYYAPLKIYDTFSLVTAAREQEYGRQTVKVPGHDRVIGHEAFLPEKPTYFHVQLHPTGSKEAADYKRLWRRHSLADLLEEVTTPAREPGPNGEALEVTRLRFKSWDWLGFRFMPVLEAARDLDLEDAERARSQLEVRFDPNGGAGRALLATARELEAAGRIAQAGAAPFRFSRASRDCPETFGYSVEVSILGAKSPRHRLPHGKVQLALPWEGQPTLNGEPPGWTVFPPGTEHEPSVEGGTMLILSLIPSGEFEWVL